jgi:hypothetical protein
MAATWRHVYRFAPGSGVSTKFPLGPETPKGHTGEQPCCSGTLRLAFPGPEYPPERYYARIFCPDSGVEFFAVDLPLDLDVDLPVLVEVLRDPEPGHAPRPMPAADVVGTCFPIPLTSRRYGATRSEQALEGGTVPIPSQCQAVSLSNLAATGQWIDAAGVVLSTFIGWDNVRPRTAVAVNLLQNPSTIVFHFTT